MKQVSGFRIQRTDDRGQKTDARSRITEDRRQNVEGGSGNLLNSEVGRKEVKKFGR